MRPPTPLCSIHCHAGPSTRRVTTFPHAKQFSTTTARNPRSQGHYEALKIPRNATRQQVKAKFYELSKKFHPDSPSGGSAERFHEINDAYGILGDDSKRQQYDRSLDSSSNWGPQTTRQGSAYGTYPSSSPSFNQSYSRPTPSGPHRAWSNPSSSSSSSSSSASSRNSSFDFPNNLRYGPSGSSGGYGGPSSHSNADPFATLSTAARNAWKQDYRAQKLRSSDRERGREPGDGANASSALGSVMLIVVLLGGIMLATRGVGTKLAGEEDWSRYPAFVEGEGTRRGKKSTVSDEEAS